MSKTSRISRLSIAAFFAVSAIAFHANAAFASGVCDNFVNPCSLGSATSWTVNDTIVTATGEAGEPPAHTFYTTAQNPLTSNWYHWTAPQNGMVVVNMVGTNPNALPPQYTTPFVMDTVMSAYTGAAFPTLVRVDESDDWEVGAPPNSSCTYQRPLPEAYWTSCMQFNVTAGTLYHFQIDHLNETDPANNDFVLNLYYRSPTSASVSVGGQVTDGAGSGVGKVRVGMTNTNGEIMTALTNPFGYYRFGDVEAGRTYFLEAESKRFQFQNNPRVLTIGEDLLNEDFIAIGQTAFPDKR